MYMKTAVLVFVMTAVACGGTSSYEPQTPERHPGPESTSLASTAPERCNAVLENASPQAHLDAIATCFHAAILSLNREPDEGETLEEFMTAAELPGAPPLVLDDGVVVEIEVVDRWHDDLVGGGATFGTTYRFSAPGHQETAERSIVLTIGGEE
jgi:hypothetical protein